VKQKEKQRAGQDVGRGYHKRLIGMNSVPAGAHRRTLAPLIIATGLGAARERVTVTHHSILVQEAAITETAITPLPAKAAIAITPLVDSGGRIGVKKL
jgi:hypothetical protein